MNADKTHWENTRRGQYKNPKSYIERIMEVNPHKKTAVRPCTSHL